ncbi:protein of unknown function [Friedmanniella luteola]|uniref:DUF4386 domain-containing protein n=1 Tax=Friedmanniella luteola TaxID=546871 RepID=A0A1H1SU90_9ACTN|nr:DUF4386 domain-containing protein [Friedmanniella luteola]SDS51504.1 protein of unknown function [Friedmanniella luteola]
MRRLPVAGALLVGSAVLSLVGYAVLGTKFGWPAVLDEPGTVALDRFVEAEPWVRVGFYAFLLSSLVLVPAAVALEDGLTRGQAAARTITAFGVLGAFAQMLGWVRWPLAVPALADRWTDPSAGQADLAVTAAVYDLLNGYAGGAVGEHLGWLLQGVWAVGVSLWVLRARGLPPWFAVLGVALSVVWALLVPVATAFGLPTLEFWSLNVYTAWYLWLLALGVLLMVRRVEPPAEPVLDRVRRQLPAVGS